MASYGRFPKSSIDSTLFRSQFNSALPALLGILVLSAVSVASVLLFATNEIDRVARQEKHDRVEVALQIEAQRLLDLVVDYTYWDLAYSNLIATPDPAWADDNIGSYMAETLSISLSLAANSKDQVTIAFLDGTKEEFAVEALRDNGLARVVARARGEKEATDAFSCYTPFQGKPFLIGVNTFAPEDDSSPMVDGSFLVLGRRIDSAFITRLSKLYRISGLRLTDDPVVDERLLLPIVWSQHDAPLRLTWEDPAPAARIGRQVYLLLLGIAVVMLLLIVSVFQSEHRKRRQHLEALAELALHDPLTGASNRIDFVEKAEREIARSARHGHSLTLLLLDIDHFKEVNDSWGHKAGDAALIHLVQIISGILRQFDLLVRLGGEEFAVLLPESSLTQGLDIAERIRKRVETMTVSPIPQQYPITVSIGVAELVQGETLESLLARADQALYQAKVAGRNRCIAAER